MVCPAVGVAAISELTVAITEVTHRALIIGPPRVLAGERIVSAMRRLGYWTMVWIDAFIDATPSLDVIQLSPSRDICVYADGLPD